MGLKINGSIDGSIEIDVPASCGSDLSVTLPATAGEIVVANTSGDVDLGGLTVSGSAGDDSVNVDSSGRLLVGTSSAGSSLTNTIELAGAGTIFNQPAYQVYSYPGSSGTSTGYFQFFRSASGTLGTNSLVADDDRLGLLRWSGADGTGYIPAAEIYAEVDATPGSSDMPGRLVFSTTVNGASSPTERMRISNSGEVLVGRTTASIATEGHYFLVGGAFSHTRNSATIGEINRLGNDGTLINFRQATNIEGSISVSGSTVSYNGAHLSRWSQLASGAERTEILRGSVLSNLDEMCEWGDEDNEQLNRMKVSDVEGDPNVSGVFQSWDDDDDTYTNDFYCAMTGDFIIRIAQGTTVQRGDLLMSAGDGTAKPQDDDIIRSKTIAKVTSTNVSCTYDDGSYCVPCVLMAC